MKITINISEDQIKEVMDEFEMEFLENEISEKQLKKCLKEFLTEHYSESENLFELVAAKLSDKKLSTLLRNL